MDADTKYHLDLIRSDQGEKHDEICSRLKGVEDNITEFIRIAAVKSEIQQLHDRISKTNDNLIEQLKARDEKITTIEKQLENYRGQIGALKLVGGILAGLAIIIEPIIIWWISRKR